MTVDLAEAPSGGYTFATFRVPHGCDGSPTTKIAVQIPDGVVSVKPEAVPGWKIDIVRGPITPYDSHGTMISEGVKEVSWTGGPLPDEHVAQLGMSLKMPEGAGETVYFPVVQTCEVGVTRWIEIPSGDSTEELEHPAPGIKLVAAAEEGADDEAKVAQPGAVSDDDGTDPMTVVALVAGLAGLAAGAFALRRRPGATKPSA